MKRGVVRVGLMLAGVTFFLVFISSLTAFASDKDYKPYGSYPQKVKKRSRLGGPLPYYQTTHFAGSSNCANCHTYLVDRAGNDMSIVNHWRSTMMANAARDPLWQAKVKSEVKRNPALKEVIEAKCISCHMPIASTQKKALGNAYVPAVTTGAFDDLLSSSSSLHKAAYDGVACALCHQIQDIGLGTKETFSGKYKIDLETQKPNRKIFGPFKETVRETMIESIGFDPVYGPHMNDSALCAACHTLYTPFVDAKGNVVGEFPEQTVYLEWLHSEFGEKLGERHDIGETKGKIRICQECHMPHSEAGGVVIAKYAPPEVLPKDHFSKHFFVGGNVFLINIIQDYMERLEVSSSTAKLEDTKMRTLKLLQTQTATLSITEATRKGERLQVQVDVDNLVGHKFPSGIPTRMTWIHFTVIDNNGTIVFESGKPQPDGSVQGNDAESGSYEKHYDRITNQDQVQIYEAIMANTDGEVTFTLLRAATYLKDNRLLPKGFDKKTAGKDFAVYGQATNDDNFAGGIDQVEYDVNIKNLQGPVTVKAELLFTTVSKPFMNDLRSDADEKLVGRFVGYYDKADKTPVTIAMAEKKVQ